MMGRDLNDVLREEGADAVQARFDNAQVYTNGAAGPGYGHNSGVTPLFRELPSTHQFPVIALGEVLGDAARAFEAATRAPMAICATAALSVATLAAQAHADIELPTGEVSPLSEFFFTIARSGERKTSNDSRALKPARSFELELAEHHRSNFEDYERKAAAYEARKKEILSPKEKLDYAGKIKKLKDELGAPPKPPTKPFLTMSDLTAEGAAKYLLHEGYPSIGIFTTEGGQLVGGHGFTPEAKLRTAAFFNRLWDAGRVERFRAGEAAVASGKRVSMHIQIQDDIASAFFSDPILSKVGLLGRILATDPPSTQGSRVWREPEPYHQIAIARYAAHIQAIFRVPLPLKEGSDTELAPRVLIMSHEARARWIAFHDQIEIELDVEKGAFAPISSLANKLPEHAARLAGILAITEDAYAQEVTDDQMARGIWLAEFYAAEAFRLHGVAQIDPQLREADALCKRLRDAFDCNEFQVRDVLALKITTIATADKGRALLGILKDNGHVERIEKEGLNKRMVEYWRMLKE